MARSPIHRRPMGAAAGAFCHGRSRAGGAASAGGAVAGADARGHPAGGGRNPHACAGTAVLRRPGRDRRDDRARAAGFGPGRFAEGLAAVRRGDPAGDGGQHLARLAAGALAGAARHHRHLGGLARRGERDGPDVGRLRCRHAPGCLHAVPACGVRRHAGLGGGRRLDEWFGWGGGGGLVSAGGLAGLRRDARCHRRRRRAGPAVCASRRAPCSDRWRSASCCRARGS